MDRDVIIYHGTLLGYLDGILERGIDEGDGLFGFSGVFFEKRMEDTFHWSLMKMEQVQDEFYGKKADVKGKGGVRGEYMDLIAVAVKIPASHVKFLTPDFNQDDFDESYGGIEHLPMDTKWEDERVFSVAYNRCKANDKDWVEWYKEYGSPEIAMGSCKDTRIPPEWIVGIFIFRRDTWVSYVPEGYDDAFRKLSG